MTGQRHSSANKSTAYQPSHKILKISAKQVAMETSVQQLLQDCFKSPKLTLNDLEVRIRISPLYSIIKQRDSNTSGATSLHLQENKQTTTNMYTTTTQGGHICSYIDGQLSALSNNTEPPHAPSYQTADSHLLTTLSPSVSTEVEMLSGQASNIVTCNTTMGVLSFHMASGSCCVERHHNTRV